MNTDLILQEIFQKMIDTLSTLESQIVTTSLEPFCQLEQEAKNLCRKMESCEHHLQEEFKPLLENILLRIDCLEEQLLKSQKNHLPQKPSHSHIISNYQKVYK